MDKFEEKAEKMKVEYLEEQKKKAETEKSKVEKKKATQKAAAASTTPTKKLLNPNFVKVDSETGQGSDKKQP